LIQGDPGGVRKVVRPLVELRFLAVCGEIDELSPSGGVVDGWCVVGDLVPIRVTD